MIKQMSNFLYEYKSKIPVVKALANKQTFRKNRKNLTTFLMILLGLAMSGSILTCLFLAIGEIMQLWNFPFWFMATAFILTAITNILGLKVSMIMEKKYNEQTKTP